MKFQLYNYLKMCPIFRITLFIVFHRFFVESENQVLQGKITIITPPSYKNTIQSFNLNNDIRLFNKTEDLNKILNQTRKSNNNSSVKWRANEVNYWSAPSVYKCL